MTASHTCPVCHRPHCYSYRYDAFYCQHCDRRLTPVCADKHCRLCAGREPSPMVNRVLAPGRAVEFETRHHAQRP
jgi:hypothetical protein